MWLVDLVESLKGGVFLLGLLYRFGAKQKFVAKKDPDVLKESRILHVQYAF